MSKSICFGESSAPERSHLPPTPSGAGEAQGGGISAHERPSGRWRTLCRFR
jgi:hypothetical protein